MELHEIIEELKINLPLSEEDKCLIEAGNIRTALKLGVRHDIDGVAKVTGFELFHGRQSGDVIGYVEDRNWFSYPVSDLSLNEPIEAYVTQFYQDCVGGPAKTR